MSNLVKKCLISGDIFVTETVLTGLQQNDDITEYYVFDSSERRRDELEKKYRLNICSNPEDFVKDSAFIIFACKPEEAENILNKISHKVSNETLIVSFVRTLKMENLEKYFPDNGIVRLTINPSVISGEGVGAYFVNKENHSNVLQELILKFGNIIKVNSEAELESVRNFILANTFLSYIVVKSMVDAGQKIGFSMQQAGLITDHILKGASKTLIKFQFEGGEMLKEGLRHTNITNQAIDLIKSYGIYDSIERYLTSKEIQLLFDSYQNDDDKPVEAQFNWFEKVVSQ